MKSTIWSRETASKHHRHSPRIAAELGNWLPKDVPVLDFGCGVGFYLRELAQTGYRGRGIEGTPDLGELALHDDIVIADLTLPLPLDWPRSSVLCLEVAEHLPSAAEPQLLESIDAYCHSVLIVSWAIPGQKGTGHINCRPNSYVHERFQSLGFELWPAATFALREAAEEHVRYFRNSLLAFRRIDAQDALSAGQIPKS